MNEATKTQSVRITPAMQRIIDRIHDAHPHLSQNARGQNVNGAIRVALEHWAQSTGNWPEEDIIAD